MSDFLEDAFSPLEISEERLMEILIKLSTLWPKEITFRDKKFGIDSFTCRSIVELGRLARENFETIDWDGDEEIAGVALDFFGMAIKNSSKYLLHLRTEDIDYDMIVFNIKARDDIIVL